jgi:hypothetical protein
MTVPRTRKELVVASMKGDDVLWLYQNLTDWHKSVYVVNGHTDLKVPVNKGRESMVYLT